MSASMSNYAKDELQTEIHILNSSGEKSSESISVTHDCRKGSIYLKFCFYIWNFPQTVAVAYTHVSLNSNRL